MDAPIGVPGDAADASFDGLLADAREALTRSANALRRVREEFRTAYIADLARWEALRDELEATDRRPAPAHPAIDGAGATSGAAEGAANPAIDGAGGIGGAPVDLFEAAARAAEAGADDARRRALRTAVATLGSDVGRRRAELGRLDLAITNLERTWLFLEHTDTSLVAEGDGQVASPDVQMRIVEAQEAERARLAQEVHDGPAQALSNAIFGLEYIERVLPRNIVLARTELGFLRDVLRRELGDVRSFITQLRPPMVLEAGLEQALGNAAEQVGALLGTAVRVEIETIPATLTEAEQTVALRIVQEALQNVRKHAAADSIELRTWSEAGRWIAELRDDGRGFDTAAVAARGRRNFGLQFMRERAELIGADFEVRSRPNGGTVVRVAIPTPDQKGRQADGLQRT